MNKRSMTTAILLATLLLAACGRGMGAVSLRESKWELSDLNGQAPLDTAAPTIEFTKDGVRGSTGCNSYFGAFRVRGERLTIKDLGMTQMACEARVMEQEDAFLKALGQVERYRLALGRLEMLDATGRILLTWGPPTPLPEVDLEGTEWVLTTFIEGEVASSVLADTEITLRFDGAELSGSAGCNAYRGDYRLAGGTISYGTLAIHVELCQSPTGIMDQETRYFEILSRATAIGLEANQLTLRTKDGQALVFSPKLD